MPLRKPPGQDAIAALDERSREVFRRIVEGYIDNGEPLGSRNLSRLLPMSLPPASVRNVKGDLEELGLIYSPHVSAGRLPTQVGLRFSSSMPSCRSAISRPRNASRWSGRSGFPARQAGRKPDDRGEPGALRYVARRRPCHHGEIRSVAEACRVYPPRTDQGVGGAGRRSRPGGKPHHRLAGRHYLLAVGRGGEFPQRP